MRYVNPNRTNTVLAWAKKRKEPINAQLLQTHFSMKRMNASKWLGRMAAKGLLERAGTTGNYWLKEVLDES